jgi:hypothetical protein
MIAFEIGIALCIGLAIIGPLIFFGMRRYLRWMERMAESEELRDQQMHRS